jgi:hypothetical protein
MVTIPHGFFTLLAINGMNQQIGILQNQFQMTVST